MSIRIIVLGKDGQVGSQLISRLSANAFDVVGIGRQECDITDCDALVETLNRVRPTVIINAIAYTAVDRAETSTDEAWRVNAGSLDPLVRAANNHKALLIHYSTDYVFDGRKSEPYTVEDQTCPTSVYGKTKLAGENIVLSGCDAPVIFRTSWVFGPVGGNFLKTMLRLACERHELRVVADQLGAPTSAIFIADTTARFIERYFECDEAIRRGMTGVYHLTARGYVSWYGYAKYLVEEARARGWPIQVAEQDILPINTQEYPVPAARPANSRLDTTKLENLLGIEFPDWKEGVRTVLDMLPKDARPPSL